MRAQVLWVNSDPGEELRLYSTSLDGRLSLWCCKGADLRSSDVLVFTSGQLGMQGKR